jgi:hypothetical protein
MKPVWRNGFSNILIGLLEVDGKKGPLEEDDNIKSKSKTTQALKLFSELKTPVEVAIALDLPVDQVRTIYREYWELDGMYKLAQIYAFVVLVLVGRKTST